MSAMAALLGNSARARSSPSGSVAMMYVPTPRMRRASDGATAPM